MNSRRPLSDRASAIPPLAEAFRDHGFEGASLAVLSKATGLGKGSLYNFFPGGKEEMMDAVLEHVDQWFDQAIFQPLAEAADSSVAIGAMMDNVTAYFRAGRRICLVGLLGLGPARATFAGPIEAYFDRWITALAGCLQAGRVPPDLATELAEECVGAIQGAIVLSRALDRKDTFERIAGRLRGRLLDALGRGSQE